MRHLGQFRLLTLHFCLFQLSASLAGGFVGAYLLRLGFSLPTALLVYATLLTARFGLRLGVLAVVPQIGLRGAIIAGAGLSALQFPLLNRADDLAWLGLWLLMVAVAESFYWPVFHAAAAVTGGGASRGRELGIRTAIGAIIGVVGPLAGGFLLGQFGPAVDFQIAAAVSMLSVLPLLAMHAIPAGPIPTVREALQVRDRVAFATFAADGLMSSGLAIAWPMVLFVSLGSHYEAFGMSNAAAGLVGAVAGIICGRAIDRGSRDRYLLLVSCTLACGFLLRAVASWSPVAASIANATGAAVMGLYSPVMMSVVYERAKQSGAAYRFHFSTDAGWDVGAAAGCIAAALVVWSTAIPSLSVLPAILGVAAIYRCVHLQTRLVDAPGHAAPMPLASDCTGPEAQAI